MPCRADGAGRYPRRSPARSPDPSRPPRLSLPHALPLRLRPLPGGAAARRARAGRRPRAGCRRPASLRRRRPSRASWRSLHRPSRLKLATEREGEPMTRRVRSKAALLAGSRLSPRRPTGLDRSARRGRRHPGRRPILRDPDVRSARAFEPTASIVGPRYLRHATDLPGQRRLEAGPARSAGLPGLRGREDVHSTSGVTSASPTGRP